jgi:hypothetical protein
MKAIFSTSVYFFSRILILLSHFPLSLLTWGAALPLKYVVVWRKLLEEDVHASSHLSLWVKIFLFIQCDLFSFLHPCRHPSGVGATAASSLPH